MYTGKSLNNHQDQHVVHQYERVAKNGELVTARRIYQANPDLKQLFDQVNQQYGVEL